MTPIGEIQVGPRREIRFRTEPVTLPGNSVMLVLSPGVYGLVVKAESVGEDGYTKAEIKGSCRKASLRRVQKL